MKKQHNLIALAGRAGAGKNLCATIIQLLVWNDKTNYQLTLDELARGAMDEKTKWQASISSGWQEKKFAMKLKQMAALACGCNVEDFESQEFKASFMPREWDIIVPKPGLRQDGFIGSVEYVIKQMTYRDLLESMGNKMREVNKDFWLNGLFADYKPVRSLNERILNCGINECDQDWIPGKLPSWLITDLRYINEADKVNEHGGLVILIDRPSQNGNPLFQSEKELHLINPQHRVVNDRSIKDLIEDFRQILITEQLIAA